MPNPWSNFGPKSSIHRGTRISGARRSAPALPPDLSNLLHWFDFTDLTQMFTDTAGTMPVVFTGDDISRINNKGSDGTPLLQAAPLDRMELDLAFHANPSALASDVGGNRGSIGAAIANGIAGSYTFCIITALGQDVLAVISASWDQAIPSTGFQIRHNGSGVLNVTTPSTTTVIPGVNTQTIGVYDAIIGVCRTNDTQEIWFSLDAATATDTALFAAIADAGDFAIGAEQLVGGFDFEGHIGGVLVWNSDETVSIADIQDYVTARFGVVWA